MWHFAPLDTQLHKEIEQDKIVSPNIQEYFWSLAPRLYKATDSCRE